MPTQHINVSVTFARLRCNSHLLRRMLRCVSTSQQHDRGRYSHPRYRGRHNYLKYRLHCVKYTLHALWRVGCMDDEIRMRGRLRCEV